MSHDAPAIFIALEHSHFAAAIRQSGWLYPIANVGHIVSLVIFAGAVTVMDVRLLGGFAATAPGRVFTWARRWTIGGFALMVVTGFFLFTAEASHMIMNPVCQIKVAIIGIALANVALFEFVAKRAVIDLAPGAAMPARAKVAGLLSIGLWLVVAACGRSIAYF